MATIKIKINRLYLCILVQRSPSKLFVFAQTQTKWDAIYYLFEIAHSLIANTYLIWKYLLLAFDCKIKSLLGKLNGTFSRLENTYENRYHFYYFFSLSWVIDNKLLSLYLLCGSPPRSQHSDTIESCTTIALAHTIARVCSCLVFFSRGANNVATTMRMCIYKIRYEKYHTLKLTNKHRQRRPNKINKKSKEEKVNETALTQRPTTRNLQPMALSVLTTCTHKFFYTQIYSFEQCFSSRFDFFLFSSSSSAFSSLSSAEIRVFRFITLNSFEKVPTVCVEYTHARIRNAYTYFDPCVFFRCFVCLRVSEIHISFKAKCVYLVKKNIYITV